MSMNHFYQKLHKKAEVLVAEPKESENKEMPVGAYTLPNYMKTVSLRS